MASIPKWCSDELHRFSQFIPDNAEDSRFSDEELNAGKPKHFFKKKKQNYNAVSFPPIDVVNQGNWILSTELRLEAFVAAEKCY